MKKKGVVCERWSDMSNFTGVTTYAEYTATLLEYICLTDIYTNLVPAVNILNSRLIQIPCLRLKPSFFSTFCLLIEESALLSPRLHSPHSTVAGSSKT